MSTVPPVSDPQPQQPDPNTMPLGDLKAAVNTPPPAEPTPTPAAEPTPAPTPTPAEPYHIETQADGTVHIKLDTGEEFKGTWAEVGPKLAKSKYDSSKYAKDLKAQLEAKTTPEPAPQQPTQPQVDEETLKARDWMLEQQAAAFGMTKEQYVQAVESIFQTTQKMAVSTTYADFFKACPDYVDTPENAQVVMSYIPEGVTPQMLTVDHLRRAHAAALYDKKYSAAPAAPAAATPPRNVPPPMPSGGSAPSGDLDPWNMPLDQLKKQANRGQ